MPPHRHHLHPYLHAPMSDPSLPSTTHGRARSRPPSQAATRRSRASGGGADRGHGHGDGGGAVNTASRSASSSSGADGQLTASQKATMAGALALGGLVLVAGILAWRSRWVEPLPVATGSFAMY